MPAAFIRSFGVLSLLGAAGAVTFALLLDRVAPAASVDLHYSRPEIMERSAAYMAGLGYRLDDLRQDCDFSFNGTVQLVLQSRDGMRRANAALRTDTIAGHHWYVTWYDPTRSRSQSTESFDLWMSPAGTVLGFEHSIRDSATLSSLTRDEALRKAEAFLTAAGFDLSRFELRTSSETQQPNRLDHRFVWGIDDSTLESRLWAVIQGDEVGGFRLSRELAGGFQQSFSTVQTVATFLSTASFAVFFLLFFFIVILFLKKYHEGEVGTRTALLVFIGLFAAMVVGTLIAFPTVGGSVRMGDMNPFNTRLIMLGMTILIFHAFTAVMVFAAWAVGESSSRSVWPKKMTGVDSFLFWRLNTLDVAEGLVRGYALGLALAGGAALTVWGVIETGISGVFLLGINSVPDSFLPGLRPALLGLTTAVITEIVFRLFFLSYLREKTKRTWLAVAVSCLLMTVTTFVTWEPPFGFFLLWPSIVALMLYGLAFAWIYLKYDLLTSITANFILTGLVIAIPLFTSTGAGMAAHRWLALGTLGAPLLLAAGGFVTGRRFEFTPQTLPTHILRITERERMAKELEIARKVQMSLLPKTNPVVEGYDISGICIPALEVGGDYYDFVSLGGRRMGIAIGDVSGKGVPAAIYMTLTKGILQSHAEENVSPKRVLSKVNSLMYRTIDRNSFVSMFYAILDPEARTIRFARAGQCPVIVAQRSGEQGSFLTPRGMALGLERGGVFDAVLEEQEMRLTPGEVLVFYTDGFTEARTAQGEEFGEERLVGAISRHRAKPAADIIRGICDDVTTFTAGHPQHDDMTMVVVKVS
jgi:sigma-B regulation protein RsbU (phosphoserine phosphatase)